MRLRFVKGTKIESQLILLRENVAMPFTPSHVEAEIISNGAVGYVGAHFSGGIAWRPKGYDSGVIAAEITLDLGATEVQDAAFIKFVASKIGEAYDWKSLLDFALPTDFHTVDDAICSAFMTLALRASGWLAWPVAAPAHLISPRDLLLMISARMEVPGI